MFNFSLSQLISSISISQGFLSVANVLSSQQTDDPPLSVLQIGPYRAVSVSSVSLAIRGSTVFEMFILYTALIWLCSCAAVFTDFDADLKQISDVYHETGNPHINMLSLLYTFLC